MTYYATRADYENAVRAGAEPRYRACSGQSNGPRRWGVCDELIPWWRALDSRGNTRLFGSLAAASKVAGYFNAHPEAVPAELTP